MKPTHYLSFYLVVKKLTTLVGTVSFLVTLGFALESFLLVLLGGNTKIVSKALESPALYKALRVFISRPALHILSFLTSEMPSICRVDFLPLATAFIAMSPQKVFACLANATIPFRVCSNLLLCKTLPSATTSSRESWALNCSPNNFLCTVARNFPLHSFR